MIKYSKAKRVDFAVPAFHYKNHMSIDRRYGLIRKWKATDASRHDGAQLPALLDPNNTASDVWADMPETGYFLHPKSWRSSTDHSGKENWIHGHKQAKYGSSKFPDCLTNSGNQNANRKTARRILSAVSRS